MSYEKYHDPWAESDLLSAASFNHIESQWDAIKSDADAHNHDTRYYTKTISDATFFTTSFYTGFDADTLDGYHYADLITGILPAGAIMAWSGTDATVPSGWAICTGQTVGGYTTPNLRDRFIVGAGSTYSPGATGGVGAYNATFTPTGSITVAAHALTTSELPAHSHSFTEYRRVGSYMYHAAHQEYPYNYTFISATTSSRSASIEQQATGGGSHGHSGSTISFDSVDTRPKYMALYYIMKVS